MLDFDASTPTGLHAAVAGIVDDAAIFPPGDAPLGEAATAFRDRLGTPISALVSTFVVSDHRLSELRGNTAGEPLPVSVVIGAGAGGITPAASIAQRLEHVDLRAVEVALRDPADLPGNARRVLAGVDDARSAGLLDDEVAVYVELPAGPPTAGWLAAADEIAAAELRLKFRTGGMEPDLFPDAPTLASWVEAALDRETPFKCTAGLHNALRHTDDEKGFEHQGFLNVLLATRLSLDGAEPDEVVEVLEERAADPLLGLWHQLGDETMIRTRRWFTSFGSCSVDEPWADLVALGLAPTGTGAESEEW